LIGSERWWKFEKGGGEEEEGSSSNLAEMKR
jgi:hypothetical protein